MGEASEGVGEGADEDGQEDCVDEVEAGEGAAGAEVREAAGIAVAQESWGGYYYSSDGLMVRLLRSG